MYILGISAYYHDSAACLIYNENIIAATQEERFTRKKHDPSFPINSIQYCISEANINPNEIDHIVFYEKPFLKFERLLETYLAFAPKGFKSFATSMPIWLKEKLFQKNLIKTEFKKLFGKKFNIDDKLLFSEHHLSHASSAFFPSPFDDAAIITMDGVGEWATNSLSIGTNNKIEFLKEINFPHSLGLLYSAFTFYCGFKVNSGEYKLMGLAPYGEPKYYKLILDNLIDLKDDGSYHLNQNYFNYCVGFTMTNNKFDQLFDEPPRKSEDQITQKQMNIAASIQKVTEEVMIKQANYLKKISGKKNLCLSGGVALNCVANGKIIKNKIFENIWIQPAAGDAGGAIGAAYSVLHMAQNKERESHREDLMKGSYLGPSYKNDDIKNDLEKLSAKYELLNDSEIISKTARSLSEGKAIGWMQGRMEFGPRALGNRSIIADPRSPKMQKILNLKIKYRESFRPFAPSVIREKLSEWFDLDIDSPYMLVVADIINEKKIKQSEDSAKLFGIDKLNLTRSEVPAVTHVDYSARVQTVSEKTNSRYHKLIAEFYNLTRCPLIVNTSFNVRGEPIVCNTLDAFKCFMGTELDILVIENFYLEKSKQTNFNFKNYKDTYELD